MKTISIILLALCFFAINIVVAQNTEEKQAVQKIEKEAIIKKAELQKKSQILEVKSQINGTETSATEKLVFTDDEEYEKFYQSYPNFPKYKDTGNDWAKKNKAEFKKMLKKQSKNQQTKNKNVNN